MSLHPIARLIRGKAASAMHFLANAIAGSAQCAANISR
jgi:hypothetical protein